MTETDAARIARRYPPRRTPRWAWVPLAVALALVGLLWLVWSGLYGANPAVSARVSAFHVVSDTQVDAVVTVQRPHPSSVARCTVTAKAVTYETVGELPVEIAGSPDELVDVPVSLRTFKRATSVDVGGCVILP